MRGRNLLIPIAAFAVTVTGVNAFNGEVLDRAGLTDEQKSAFEEARDLREHGDREGARDVLVEAGIDEATMEKVREAMYAYRDEQRSAIDEAVANEDYDAFVTAVADSPLSEIVTNEEDFKLFVEAHNLREAGDFEESRAIMEELGFTSPQSMRGERGHGYGGLGMGHGEPPFLDELTDSQKEAFAVAKEANDKETMKAILDEAGLTVPDLGRSGHRHHHQMHDNDAEV